MSFFFLGVGANDKVGGGLKNGGAAEGLRNLDRTLTEKGIKHTFKELPDTDHTWFAWRHFLCYDFLPNLWK
ncbi:hypothetical protein [Runella zeae]|uniref:hypothetical protein n=1 Tax=Runella zeae TaxID=94255 RepID=UPI00040AF1B2|nr:hypothetical protein [Runella zeae]